MDPARRRVHRVSSSSFIDELGRVFVRKENMKILVATQKRRMRLISVPLALKYFGNPDLTVPTAVCAPSRVIPFLRAALWDCVGVNSVLRPSCSGRLVSPDAFSAAPS